MTKPSSPSSGLPSSTASFALVDVFPLSSTTANAAAVSAATSGTTVTSAPRQPNPDEQRQFCLEVIDNALRTMDDEDDEEGHDDPSPLPTE
eukprot:scaffold5357_cov208-Amphora_coffeaeformis.AAC.7